MDMVHDFQKLNKKAEKHRKKTLSSDDEEDKSKDESIHRNDEVLIDQSVDGERIGNYNLSDINTNSKGEHIESEDEQFEQKISVPSVSKIKVKQSRTELSYLRKSEIKVLVSDGLVKKGGIFSFSYASYKVTLDPLGYSVRRREDDFIKLRKYL